MAINFETLASSGLLSDEGPLPPCRDAVLIMSTMCYISWFKSNGGNELLCAAAGAGCIPIIRRLTILRAQERIDAWARVRRTTPGSFAHSCAAW